MGGEGWEEEEEIDEYWIFNSEHTSLKTRQAKWTDVLYE